MATPIPHGSIRIQYSGTPGSVIAEVASIEQDGERVVGSDVVNEGNNFAGSGAHAWHLDDQTESILYLSNLGDQECPIGIRVQASGAPHYVTVLSLKPHETRTVSLRQLRDAQKADFLGHKIPAGATDGSVLWTRLKNLPVAGHLDVITNGQVVTPDVSAGCCCPPYYYELDVEPQSPSMLPGAQLQFTSTFKMMDCNGVHNDFPWTNSTAWSTNPPGIVSFSTTTPGLATAGATGGTTSVIANGGQWTPSMCCAGVCVKCQPEPVMGGSTLSVLTVKVNSVSLSSDQVQVTMAGGSSTNQGTLVVTWNGPSGNANIANGAYAPGTYTFNPGLGNLVGGQYTGVTAKWTLNGVQTAGSMASNFKVLGTYRHSQYNTPAESSCTGGPANAQWDNPPANCVYTMIQFKSDFIGQAWLNGSGITISQGSIQLPWGCATPFPTNSFKPVS